MCFPRGKQSTWDIIPGMNTVLLLIVASCALFGGGIAAPPAATHSEAILTLPGASIVSYWPLDDLVTHDFRVRDAFSTNDGFLTGIEDGGITVGHSDADAISNFAVRIDSSSGGIVLPTTALNAAWTSEDWSFQLWARFSSNPASSGLVSVVGCSSSEFQMSVIGNNALSVTFKGTALVSAPSTILQGEWLHIVVSYSSGTLEAFVNDVSIGTQSTGSFIAFTTCTVVLGDGAASGTLLDEVVLHDAAVSPLYRHRIYKSGTALACRSAPCFSGVECSASGAETFSCGPCPTGYSGDGIECMFSESEQLRLRFGDCIPEGETALSSPTYCLEHCGAGRRKCFVCSMSYFGPLMWLNRQACYVPSATPSLTPSPSVTATSSETPHPVASMSVSPTVTSSPVDLHYCLGDSGTDPTRGTIGNPGLSCLEVLIRRGTAATGAYYIGEFGSAVLVYCDMETDGGGWTLVASSLSSVPQDHATAYHSQLSTRDPAAATSGLWDGLRSVMPALSDVRFTCKLNGGVSATQTVDLSYYDVPWYLEITASTNEADVCFEQGNGAGALDPPPARRNNINGQFRPVGDEFGYGYMEGEDACSSNDDFAVDFDDRGMDSLEIDGTDWGADDGNSKCGSSYGNSGSTFQVWARESCRQYVTPTTTPSPSISPSTPPTGFGYTFSQPASSCKEIRDAVAGAPSYLAYVNADGTTRAVFCDMDVDGGGWTLVASTRGTTLSDHASEYYTDLATIDPESGHPGIWNGMRSVITGNSDIRFACKREPEYDFFDVDLSFYNVQWYSEITASFSDSDVCFEEADGAGHTSPAPARRNNISGVSLSVGDAWGAGYMEGEDQCGDLGDFTVDFDDRGMDSDQSDGTDWGSDDNVRKCGGVDATGTWYIFVREI